MNTKQKILDAALELFSTFGYDGVSVAQIGEAVGIKAPSLYKHFKSKQEIFETIQNLMQERYNRQALKLHIENKSDGGGDVFAKITEEQLIQTVLQLFRFFLLDAYMEKFRRMMILEQYRNPQIGALYRKQYFDDPIRYQTALFRQLMAAGVLREEDPKTAAVTFYSPIFLQLLLCDQHPERIPEAEMCIKNHIRHFGACYRKGNV